MPNVVLPTCEKARKASNQPINAEIVEPGAELPPSLKLWSTPLLKDPLVVRVEANEQYWADPKAAAKRQITKEGLHHFVHIVYGELTAINAFQFAHMSDCVSTDALEFLEAWSLRVNFVERHSPIIAFDDSPA